MVITVGQVEKIAKLARVRLEESEKETTRKRLGAIFDWIDKLSEVDVGAVNLTEALPTPAREREDEVAETDREAVLVNAPKVAHHMYVVPKVVE